MDRIRYARRRLVPEAIALALVGLCALAGCAAPRGLGGGEDAAPERLVRLLSFEARQEQSAIARRSVWYHDSVLEGYIGGILARLMPADLPSEIAPRVILVGDVDANAYSFPDGTIYLHTGILVRLENEAELALLLAHELVHISRQHALRALMAYEKGTSPRPLPASTSETGFGLQELTAWFGDGLSDEYILNLRRNLEWEADRVGLDILTSAHYDPNEAFEIFEHLKDVAEKPQDAERGRRLAAAIAAGGVAKTGAATDRRVFDNYLLPLLMDQAVRELRFGRFAPALRFAERYARLAPQDARGHHLLGEIFRQRNRAGDLGRALAHYERAIAVQPAVPEPYKAIGIIHLKQGQPRLASSFFKISLALAPPSAERAYTASYLDQCQQQIEGDGL